MDSVKVNGREKLTYELSYGVLKWICILVNDIRSVNITWELFLVYIDNVLRSELIVWDTLIRQNGIISNVSSLCCNTYKNTRSHMSRKEHKHISKYALVYYTV